MATTCLLTIRRWLAWLALLCLGGGRNGPPARASPARNAHWDMDRVLLKFSPQDPWTIRDSLEGIFITGATGSGKTSGSGKALAQSFLRAGYGALILCAKPDEKETWLRYAEKTGRAQDVVIIGADAQNSFNFLDYELKQSKTGMTENIVALLTTVVQIVEGDQGNHGGDKFWERASKELVRNTVDLLSIARGTLTLENICRVILEAPLSPDDVADEQWQATSFCAQIIREADLAPKDRRQAHDFEMATRFYLNHIPNLADRTRSSVIATFTSVADILLHGLAHELLCTSTTWVPEICFEGAITIVSLPVQEFFETGRVIQGLIKYMWQRAVLRRDVTKHPRFVTLWADEVQYFLSPYDRVFTSVARSARCATVFLTQSTSNLYSSAKGRDSADALMANFVTKIFHANSGPTNQYASDIISKEWMTNYNYSSNRSGGQGGNGSSSGGSDTVQSKLLPSALTTLRTGGHHHNALVDAYIVRTGRIWKASQDIYIKVTFSQRG